MPYLINDEKSMFNPKITYGRAGDEVEVISERGAVLIVKNLSTGENISVTAEDITNRKPKETPPAQQQQALTNLPIAAPAAAATIINQPTGSSNKAVGQKPTQPSLF